MRIPGQLVGRFGIRIPAVLSARRDERTRAAPVPGVRQKALLCRAAEVTFADRARIDPGPAGCAGPGSPVAGAASAGRARQAARTGRARPGTRALIRAAGTGSAVRATFPCAGGPSPGWPRVPASAIIAGCGVPVSAGLAACLCLPGRCLARGPAGRAGARARGVLSGLGDESLAVTGTAAEGPAGGAVARGGA